MAKATQYMYLVDGLTTEKAEMLRKALKIKEYIIEVAAKLNSGVVIISAKKNPEKDLKMACSIAGITYRMKYDRKKSNYWA